MEIGLSRCTRSYYPESNMITRAVCRILVGREDELSTLEDALLAACRGEGSVVVLAGDAGMGKSRLCSELSDRAERIGATVMEGSCSEADIALPVPAFSRGDRELSGEKWLESRTAIGNGTIGGCISGRYGANIEFTSSAKLYYPSIRLFGST